MVAKVEVPFKFTEEEVMIGVVLQPQASLTPEELYKFCREKLPAFMELRYIKFLPELPPTPTQRVRKVLLAERYCL